MKQSSNWYIAAIHYLIAGLAVPFVIRLVVVVLIAIFSQSLLNKPVLIEVIVSIYYLLAVWLGVICGAKYVNKTYVIKDPTKIIKLATIYFVVGGAIISGYNLISTGILEVGHLIFIVAIAVFYLVSKKYIKANS